MQDAPYSLKPKSSNKYTSHHDNYTHLTPRPSQSNLHL